MSWLEALDIAGFRFVNQSLSAPWLDWLLPVFTESSWFIPVVLVVGVVLAWKGGGRGRLCAVMLLLLVGGFNNLVCDRLKRAFARPRPFIAMPETRLRTGRGGSYSMPSSHAANWFAATAVTAFYYRRSLRFMAPLAAAVGFSRVYAGVHYPGDVLVGALSGAATGAGGLWFLEVLWRRGGRRWFPLWWRRLPSLIEARVHLDPLVWQQDGPQVRDEKTIGERQWVRLGQVTVCAILLARLAYLASGAIELSEDEAYQWHWSKHLDLSYYSKPPMIAYSQFLGTTLWGDNAFGVRFLSPVIGAVISLVLLRFFALQFTARAGFWLLLAVSATPLMAVGSVLMTIDPLSVMFWVLGLVAGWRAVQHDAPTRAWLWVGLWLGLGFLSKYVALLQWLCFAVFFILWPPARRHLLRPGPYLAVAVNALCALPVVLWNASHGWITVTHLEERAGLSETWRPTIGFLLDFTLAEFGLLNPVFFCAVVWAIVGLWRRRRHDARLIYLFSMGAPVFLIYWAYTLRARVQPNWIAPAVLPLFALAAAYGDALWQAGEKRVKAWLVAGLALGLPAVILCHETNLVRKIAAGHSLPSPVDPLRRVRGWSEAARLVGEARKSLETEGKPVFIIGDHYGITSLVSFYLPEARKGVPENPIVYCLSSDRPLNQFYFWPGYEGRKGQDAVFVRLYKQKAPLPESLEREFDSVVPIGVRDVIYRGRVLRQIELFACRGLRKAAR